MSKNRKKKTVNIKRLNQNRLRLSVFRSNTQIYAQIIDDQKGITVASANSLKISSKSGKDAAEKVGIELAEKAKQKKVKEIYLEKNNYKYTGRLQVLCEAARKNGLIF